MRGDAMVIDSYAQHLFGDPLSMSNFIVKQGLNGWAGVHLSSTEIADRLIVGGHYSILSDLLMYKVCDGFVFKDKDISNGRAVVRLAAMSKCCILTQEALSSKGKPDERQKTLDAIKSLSEIAGKSELGAAVNSFAKRQKDLLELRLETPAKMRWLKFTGDKQLKAICKVDMRCKMTAIRMP